MFDKESQPTLQRVGRRLLGVGQRLYIACTHTPIVEELELESTLESADYGYELADSNVDPTNIGVWVRALRQVVLNL